MENTVKRFGIYDNQNLLSADGSRSGGHRHHRHGRGHGLANNRIGGFGIAVVSNPICIAIEKEIAGYEARLQLAIMNQDGEAMQKWKNAIAHAQERLNQCVGANPYSPYGSAYSSPMWVVPVRRSRFDGKENQTHDDMSGGERYLNVAGDDCGEGSVYDAAKDMCVPDAGNKTLLDKIGGVVDWVTTNVDKMGNSIITVTGAIKGVKTGGSTITTPNYGRPKDEGLSPLAIAGIAFAGILVIGGIVYAATRKK